MLKTKLNVLTLRKEPLPTVIFHEPEAIELCSTNPHAKSRTHAGYKVAYTLIFCKFDPLITMDVCVYNLISIPLILWSGFSQVLANELCELSSAKYQNQHFQSKILALRVCEGVPLCATS